MTKNVLNQNGKYVQELINTIDTNFRFNNKPINRIKDNELKKALEGTNKQQKLINLKNRINSIENCNLKGSSIDPLIGNGNINSPLMIVGEAPGKEEIISGQSFQGDTGLLLKKMLIAINIKIEDAYLTYTVNYRPPEDRKPSSHEIKRYAVFLKEHISIINPKLIILMGSTAMEAVTGYSGKITNERGKWKEILFKDKTIPIMITFNPSYLIRFPENKKFSWEDLKKIKKKIKALNIKI